MEHLEGSAYVDLAYLAEINGTVSIHPEHAADGSADSFPQKRDVPSADVTGGIMFVPEWKRQVIYLDFDGELTKYRNTDLDLEIDDVQVEDSNLTPERIAGIVASLNADFSAKNVLFVTERPKDTVYSTIFVGKTSTFDQYGQFAGLAETVDHGNQIKDDNAFVLLDAVNSDSDIVSTIAHEAGHLLGNLDHGGPRLVRYAEDDRDYFTYWYLENNCTITGELTSSVSLEHLNDRMTIFDAYIHEEHVDTYVSKGKLYDTARNLTILGGGDLSVNYGTTAYNVDIKSGGTLCLFRGSISGAKVSNGGCLSRTGNYYSSYGETVGVFVCAGAEVYGEYQNITLEANGGTVEKFANLSDINQQFSFVGYAWANVQNQTLSDLVCLGTLNVNSGGIVYNGTIVSGASWNITSDGKVNSLTINNGGSAYIGSKGLLEESFNNDGFLFIDSGGTIAIWSASFTSSSFSNWGRIEFRVASATVDNAIPLLNDYTKVDGGEYSITVNIDQEIGEYRLLGNAAAFKESISIWVTNHNEATDLADNSTLSGTFKWNGTGYNTVVLDNQAYTLKIDEKDDLVLSVAQPLNIVNFEHLKASVSTDWEQYKVQIRLDNFNDNFEHGWGKKTNHRSYFSLSVSDLALTAVGSADHIDLTCNGCVTGLIGVLKVGIDLGQAAEGVSSEGNTNAANDDNRAGLYLSLNKDENGDWDWGDWDFVGTVSVTLQKADHRFKFRFFDTTFDPMKITGTADINTKTGVYTITGEWNKSGWKNGQIITVSGTLKDAGTDLQLSSLKISAKDNDTRARIDTGFHIYEIEGECYNLAQCDEGAAGFKGTIGFTWNSFTIRIKEDWQKEFLSKAGLLESATDNMLKISVVDTVLSVKMNSDGDFNAHGEVRLGNIGSKSVAQAIGEVQYYASNKSLTVIGVVDWGGLVNLHSQGFLWAINNTTQVSTEGTFEIPGWMKIMTGYAKLSGTMELISTDYSTCIAVWGEASGNNKSSYMGYLYNLTTGDIKKISNSEDVDATYNTLAKELQMGMTGSALYKIRMEQYERVRQLLFKGSYDDFKKGKMQARITNETTGKSILVCYSESTEEITPVKSVVRDGNDEFDELPAETVDKDAVIPAPFTVESNVDPEYLQLIVEYFDTTGFSIRITGKQEFLWGDWRVDILNEEADMSGIELNLQCEESPDCQLENYSITGIDSESITVDYSVSGGGDDVNVFVYRINHGAEEGAPRAVCAGVLDVGENQHATIDTTYFSENGFYEFYLHVTGEFIPIDSEIKGVFSLTERNASDSALVENATDIKATECWLVVSSNQEFGKYTLVNSAGGFNKSFTVVTDTDNIVGTISIGETITAEGIGYTLDLTDDVLSIKVAYINSNIIPTHLVCTADKVSWESSGANGYIVEYSTDNFEHVISVVTTGNAIDMPDLPAGTYQWRVKADANSGWAFGEAIVSEADSYTPKVVQSNEDGNDDLFFASPNGTWSSLYYAQHVGSINDWAGTNEMISASGKGRVQNLFFGSADPNVLCLTDEESGDAIFVDDVYTELPEEIEEQTARLYRIREIRAGAGDDIVDMTSQRFEYVGEGLRIHGGEGNDTIWANKGDNILFGDAGNDRIVGASGNDVIAGGIGNDRMHGGGGNDVFTFCDNWGVDNVEQLEGGKVTLWFASGNIENWNAETLTYTDGTNSVKVSGVAADKITLKFGAGENPDDADEFAALSAIGAFLDFTSERIFEESHIV